MLWKTMSQLLLDKRNMETILCSMITDCNKIERIKTKNLLGVKFDQFLKIEENFTNVIKQCNSVLSNLKL